MSRAPWCAPLRFAAVVAGVVLPMFTIGMVHADPPGGLPNPPIAGLPQPGQPITLVVEPPSLWIVAVPVDPNGCAIDMSYDNTQATPPGTVFRGQTACGSQIYAPIIRGSATLTDVFGNVVATAPQFAGRGGGPYTSEGSYVVSPTGISSPSTYGAGPVPGLDYTITYTTSITLVGGQYWAPPPSGCSLTGGQTMTCTAQITYDYIPGTKGGITPA
jgi:hypothetical protein